jgi:hypothetical protein
VQSGVGCTRCPLAWRRALENAGVDESDFAKASARELETLLCTQQDAGVFLFSGAFSERSLYDASIENSVFILRGVLSPRRYELETMNPEAAALVDFILSKQCPVSATLIDSDKTRLLRVKEIAIELANERAKSKQN